MEQLDYDLLFRRFVGLNIDDPVSDVTVFNKNRERLLAGEAAQAFFNAVLDQPRAHDLPSPSTLSSTAPWSRCGLRSRASSPRRRDRVILPITPAIRR
jgi:hypothetical protein